MEHGTPREDLRVAQGGNDLGEKVDTVGGGGFFLTHSLGKSESQLGYTENKEAKVYEL